MTIPVVNTVPGPERVTTGIVQCAGFSFLGTDFLQTKQAVCKFFCVRRKAKSCAFLFVGGDLSGRPGSAFLRAGAGADQQKRAEQAEEKEGVFHGL